MHRATQALAGFLLLVASAQSAGAQPGTAPSWYRHPPLQSGYAVATASADSALAALADALVALALEQSERRRGASATRTDSVSFGAIGVRTTRTIVVDEKAGRIEKTQATIEMKTARGAVKIEWTREAPIAQRKSAPRKKQAVKRVFNADLAGTSVRDLVAELRGAGVTVRTRSVGERHYVLLKHRVRAG